MHRNLRFKRISAFDQYYRLWIGNRYFGVLFFLILIFYSFNHHLRYGFRLKDSSKWWNWITSLIFKKKRDKIKESCQSLLCSFHNNDNTHIQFHKLVLNAHYISLEAIKSIVNWINWTLETSFQIAREMKMGFM